MPKIFLLLLGVEKATVDFSTITKTLRVAPIRCSGITNEFVDLVFVVVLKPFIDQQQQQTKTRTKKFRPISRILTRAILSEN